MRRGCPCTKRGFVICKNREKAPVSLLLCIFIGWQLGRHWFYAGFSQSPPRGSESASHEREFHASGVPWHRTKARFMHGLRLSIEWSRRFGEIACKASRLFSRGAPYLRELRRKLVWAEFTNDISSCDQTRAGRVGSCCVVGFVVLQSCVQTISSGFLCVLKSLGARCFFGYNRKSKDSDGNWRVGSCHACSG